MRRSQLVMQYGIDRLLPHRLAVDGPPVFKLRSKRGKLLLVTGTRGRCPGKNTLLDAHRSMSKR